MPKQPLLWTLPLSGEATMNPSGFPVARSAQRRAPSLHRSAPVVQPLRLLHELLHGLDGVLELGEAAGVHEDAYAFAVELHPQRQERHAVGREFRQPYLVAAKAGQDRAAPAVLPRRQQREPGITMKQQALGLLTIEILHGARGALGTTGHGWCDPSFAVTPRGPSRNPRANAPPGAASEPRSYFRRWRFLAAAVLRGLVGPSQKSGCLSHEVRQGWVVRRY